MISWYTVHMEKYIDLHTHSTYSEGTLTPRQIVEKAKEYNIKALALTDHNTVNGVSDFIVLCDKAGIKGIPGVELYASWRGITLHILGYFIDIQNHWLRVTLEELCAKRYKDIEAMAFHMKKDGFILDLDALWKTGSDYIGFGQIVAWMEKHPKNIRKMQRDLKTKNPNFFDVINFYFRKKRGPRLEETSVPMKDAMAMIVKSGGVPVLAHPAKHLTWQQDYIILELKKMGLAGIEVLSPYHTWHQIEHYQRVAKQHRLKMTGGSDLHSLIPKKDTKYVQLPWDYHKVPYAMYEQLNK